MRYIDADALSIYFDALIKHAEMEGLYNMAHVYERCLRIVKDAPTADVAPRAEVAREILADIRDKGGFNDPFVEYICLSYDELISLEKKYTEADHDPT